MNKKIFLIFAVYINLAGIDSELFSDIELKNISKFTKKQQKSIDRMYNKWFSPVLRKGLTTTKWPSKAAGKYANSKTSAKHIKKFIKEHSINCDEFKKSVSEFKTFNDFFTRELKEGARKINKEKNVIVSPADGAILLVQNVGVKTEFPIKGVTLSLEKMFKNRELAKMFHDGTVIIVRLAPWDYHRFHLPISGKPSKHKVIRGKFESVHPSVYTRGVQPLEVNERHLILHESDMGTVAIIPVGALFVGSIKYTYSPEKECKVGSEIGYFEFGGSTVVMVFQKDQIIVNENIINNSRSGKETPVKMGHKIAIKKSK